MTVKFYKYQGTGNDFIMIDNRAYGLTKGRPEVIKHLCHRHFGIGADGLILLQEKEGYDFEMVYFNSDGNESTMCGNGGRCLVQFARQLGVVGKHCRFLAIDGPHDAEALEGEVISLKMKEVDRVENTGNGYVLNTGSPHYVVFVNGLNDLDVVAEARKIRYSERFKAEGINVNFVQKVSHNEIQVRTYERGVEDETLSCGTGVVASAIALATQSGQLLSRVNITTPGGQLQVAFTPAGNGFREVYLVGPARPVFEGHLQWEV